MINPLPRIRHEVEQRFSALDFALQDDSTSQNRDFGLSALGIYHVRGIDISYNIATSGFIFSNNL